MSAPLTPSLVRVPRLATLVACRALDFAADHRALELLHRVRARLMHRTSARQIETCIPAGLVRAGLESSINDVVIARVGSRPELPTAIVKLARTEAATTALLREANAIAALKADPRFRDFPIRLPDVLVDGERDGRRYLVETLLPGISAAQLLARGESCRRIASVAVGAIGQFHLRTAGLVQVDHTMLERWINRPALAVDRVVSSTRSASLRGLVRGLSEDLEGLTLAAGWVHGDFAPGNVLMDPDGRRVTGIIDWELASRSELLALDVAMFLLAANARVGRRGLGAVIVALLGDAGPSALRSSLEEAARQGPGDPIPTGALVLLCWLRHVAANLAKSDRYARHRVWRRYNVDVVLDSLAQR